MQISKHTKLIGQTYDHPTLSLAQSELIRMLNNKFSEGVGAPILNFEFEVGGVEGYKVIFENETLKFQASTEIEILYSVYHFSERVLGYCYYQPGEDRWEKEDSVSLSEGELLNVGKALLRRRGFIQEFPVREEDSYIADWMVKHRLNYLLTWMKYYDQMSEKLLNDYQIRGITIESGHHNFEYLVPAESYFKKNSEYFAIINNKRITPHQNEDGYLQGGQVCATNPEMREVMAENLIQYCQKHPDLNVVTLIPNDGFGWCECANCSRFYDKGKKGEFFHLSEHVYLAQDLYHDLYTDVQQRVRKVIPDVTITLAAYVNYLEPGAFMKLLPGMSVHFAPYWRCINHQLFDKNCSINFEYAKSMKKWLDVKKGGEVNLYEYYMGVNLYISLPMVHHQDIFDEVLEFSQRGGDGILTQFHLPHWTAYGLNYIMMAKAMYGDGKESVKKFFNSLFGKDSVVAQEFYQKLKELLLSAGPCHIPYPRSLLKRTKLEQYEDLLEKAKELRSLKESDTLRDRLVLWMEYLLKFKVLYDCYMDGEAVVEKIDQFLIWTDKHQDQKIFLNDKVNMLFDKWKMRIKDNQPWFHYNLDWEDVYIQRHDQSLNHS